MEFGPAAPNQENYTDGSIQIQSIWRRRLWIKRPLLVFGFDDAPHGHAEVSFENVFVPANNILLGEGFRFEIAQGTGMQMMAQRALRRKVFGKSIAEHGSFLADVAKCRIEVERTRLLVLEAADQLDRLGNKTARGIIAMAKAAAPNMALMVVGTRHGNASARC
ncbi:hypothetical protein Ddye_025566 [Dipteronia dyeriana]|uniref:Acyl-CoA dehydrogenase/oxidase C-terminal domain-containing protein n=1 Tax=Dipteronia dyeriana TaxID=168575 RepID=A0AAD9WNM9_9ROSI|nr:hypothetical protein Ddye_025566 [Dipteronia dyeriana]